MAIMDRDGVYGAPRFHAEATKRKIKAHIGAEITIVAPQRHGESRLPLLISSRAGYQNLCRLVTQMKLRVPKHEPCFTCEEEIASYAEGLICLTGDEGGPLARALRCGGMEEGRRTVERLVQIFGEERRMRRIKRSG